jgi:putative flippase GtrA
VIDKLQLWSFTKFACVGVGNTAIHICIVFLLVEQLVVQPPFANAVAFAAANIVSYLLNSTWTFQQKASLVGYYRFIAVSLVGLSISWVCVVISQSIGMHYMVGVLVSVVFVAVIGFFLNRHFVFKK